jgi:hypothetical protein
VVLDSGNDDFALGIWPLVIRRLRQQSLVAQYPEEHDLEEPRGTRDVSPVGPRVWSAKLARRRVPVRGDVRPQQFLTA